jgi:hypothetical protein
MQEELNLKNPFASFNASLMNDEDIIKYWIQPRILFGRQASGIDLTGDTPIVLEGGRGTGKTMLLKWMSNEVRIKEHVAKKGTGKGFLSQVDYIGIYHRFDGPSLGSFTSRNTNDEAWETIFKHYFELVVGQRLVMFLANLLSNNCVNISEEKESEIAKQIFELSKFSAPEKVTIKSVISAFQNQLDKVFDFINCSALSQNMKFTQHPLTTGSLVFGIPVLLQTALPELQDKRFIILLDEYENLRENQQRIVNTLVKHTKLPVTFRIGTRLRGLRTNHTLNEEEFLMEDADYRKIGFEDILMAHDENYKKLLKMIAKKRLEEMPDFSKRGLMDIEYILGNLPPEDEALLIVYDKILSKNEAREFPFERYLAEAKHLHALKNLLPETSEKQDNLKRLVNKENPLFDMVNLLLLRRGFKPREVIAMYEVYISGDRKNHKYSQYQNLYDKNKIALLFQLASLNRPKQKLYAGFDIFCMLSSGIIRNFLELCYQSFNIALFLDSQTLINDGKMPFKTQSAGARIRAGRYMDVIERIPKYGNEIKSLVIQLGAIFYSWQNDEVLSEPEVTHFCIDYNALSVDARNVLDAAVQWSVLQPKKDMKGKAVLDPLLNVYALNHVLAPYFGISYRLRGRIRQFEKEDFQALMFGSEAEKKTVRNKLSKQSSSSTLHRGTSILDYVRKA